MTTKRTWMAMLVTLGLGLGMTALAPVAQAAPPAPAQAPDVGKPEKQKDIRRLLELTGSGQLGLQVMDQMITNFKQAMAGVPPKFWDQFRAAINANELVELIVPVYDRNLSHQEIKDLIKFYETPTGKKFVAALPRISQESLEAGQKWGTQLATKLVLQLQKEGFQPGGAQPKEGAK